MISARLISLLIGVASAQYAITDLLQDGTTTRFPVSQRQEPQFDPRAQAPVRNPNQAVQAVQPRGWGAPVTPRPQTNTAVNAMSSLLGSLQGSTAANPSQGSNGGQHVNGQVLSEDSTAVVSGLVEAFMHKIQLENGEKACLERNIATLTGDVMGTVGDIVTAVKALIKGKGAVGKQSAGPLVSAGLDSAMKLTSLVTLCTQLMKTCVHGDALDLLKETGRHLTNGTYLEHRFLVNGVDIAHDLADSIIAFEAHNFHRFGTDIGTSLRKILLSKATKATRLPEGVPEETIIQQATDGLMKGFFVSGAAVEIKDTAHPDVDIRINLHQCIAGNSQFFKELWMSAWDLIAQLSANGLQGFSMNGGQGQPQWSGELMTAMMQFPMALAKCGVSSDMQSMFMEAIQTLKDLKVEFHFPQDRIKTQQAAKKISEAVEAWTNWNFEQFGYELGKLFRELVMLAFPQKYSVDASGRLQRYSEVSVTTTGKKTTSVLASVVIIGGVVVSGMLISFAVARTCRSERHPLFDQDTPLADMEDGEADLMVE